MDLPMDKAKLLKQYDLEKKWDMICDQVSFHFPELLSAHIELTQPRVSFARERLLRITHARLHSGDIYTHT
jgi:hypothetical protein